MAAGMPQARRGRLGRRAEAGGAACIGVARRARAQVPELGARPRRAMARAQPPRPGRQRRAEDGAARAR
eukprot:14137251-Alexandrium_andersonii.AAC.1